MHVVALLRARKTRQPLPPPDPRSSEKETGATPRILIVEDEYLVATEMEAGLSEAGYEVAGIATTAGEALRLAEAERPALIVMDIRLAGNSDGVEAAKQIYQTTGIRCIFATAYSEPNANAPRRRAPRRAGETLFVAGRRSPPRSQPTKAVSASTRHRWPPYACASSSSKTSF